MSFPLSSIQDIIMTVEPGPVVYCLADVSPTTRHDVSYIGQTKDFERRLVQHLKGRKSGGAKYTSGFKKTAPIFVVTGLPSQTEARQLEHILHKNRVQGPTHLQNPFGSGSQARRIWQLVGAMHKERFCLKSPLTSTMQKICIKWFIKDHFEKVMSNPGVWPYEPFITHELVLRK
jgi:predicted GIY-YIG superfamily endonuclease